MILETAPAKFNMFLSVLGRRSDGFHLLELVTSVLHDWPSLHDELSAEVAPILNLTIEGPESKGLEADNSNLVIKAWHVLERETARPLPAKLSLLKRIPSGAGLGGGSSDAAAALRAGNRLYQLGLPNSTLLRLAAELGSDVPLFILGGTVLGLDLGQRVFPLKDIQLPPMLIACPGLHVSTPSVYKALTLEDISQNAPCPSLGKNESPPWHNGLTATALKVCPALAQVRDALASIGGTPLLCGSGSSWAAKFATNAERDVAVQKLNVLRPEWGFHAPQ